MAKAKKTESATDAPPKAAANKKAAGKKPASKPAAPTGSPVIDTNLAAQNAARMLTARASGSAPAAGQEGKKETSTFKQLKESFAKPHAASMNSLLNNTLSPGSKKSALPFGGGKQVGHNQTFGADASRNNLPRRTGG